jgi:hypothetical protein
MPDLQPITREGVTIPANHSFAAVNEFVHGDVHFEELQWAMLGLAKDRERIETALRDLYNVIRDLHYWRMPEEVGKAFNAAGSALANS